MNKNVIKDMPDYEMIVSGESLTDEQTPVYWVVNKVTGVVEVETRLLPQGIEYVEQLQAGLDAKRDMAEEDYEIPVGNPNVVGFK